MKPAWKILIIVVAAAIAGTTIGLSYAARDSGVDSAAEAPTGARTGSEAEAADVDGDGVVGSRDLSIAARYFHGSLPLEGTPKLDGRESADISHLAVIGQHFGLDLPVAEPTPTPTPPPTPTPAPTPNPHHHTPTPNPHPPQRYVVEANESLVFVPQNQVVAVGDTVVWTNVGQIPHTVTFDDPGIPSDSFLDAGDTFSLAFDTAGTFIYRCDFHPPDMVGTIVVQ